MGKFLAAAIIAACAIVWRLYDSLGVGRVIYNHSPGVCRQVHGPVIGSEDIELIRSEGIAFITSGIVHLQPEREHIEGKMFLYDFNQKLGTEKLEATELPIKGWPFAKNKFHPHGMSHWDVNGIIRLYVINHYDEVKHSIEVFDYDPTGPALVYNKTFKNRTFKRPNDLVAVGPDQFILTNSGTSQTNLFNTFEFLSGYQGGSVYYWDGKAPHKVLSGLAGANGIAYDQTTNKLIVSELNYNRIHAYDLAKDKKSVTLVSTVDINSAGDNLFVDTDGSVYIGCHPSMFEAAKSLNDCDGPTTSPSQILRVKFDDDYKTATITEPYANDGRELSGSSVAVLYNNQLLIGSVCKGLLHCEIADSSVL